MKKFIALILAAITMLSAVSVCAADSKSGKLVFLSLGDSIAQGAGLSSRSTEAYGAIVSAKRGYEFINDAVGGYTSSDLLDQLTNSKNARYCASDVAKADIICVSIGGNDIIKDPDISTPFSNRDYASMYTVFIAKSPTLLSALKSNISKIVSRIKELNPDAVLLVQSLYNPVFASDALRTLGGLGVSAINGTIKGAGGGTYYVPDVYSVFTQASMISSDMIHPNASGHKAIADAVDKCLSEIPQVSGGTTGTTETAAAVGSGLIQLLINFIKIIISLINGIVSLLK